VAAGDAARDEALGDRPCRGQVNIAPFGAGGTALDRCELCGMDHSVQLGLLGAESSVDGKGARNVARIAQIVRTRIDQDEFVAVHPTRRREVMQDRRARPAGDDRVVRHRIRAAPKGLGLELDLQSPLGGAIPQQRHECTESGARRALGDPHSFPARARPSAGGSGRARPADRR
jgi:hypothetical protein